MDDDDDFVYEDPFSDTAAEAPEEVAPVETAPVTAEATPPAEEPVKEPVKAKAVKDDEGFEYEDINTPSEGYYVRPERPKPEDTEVSWSDTGNSVLGGAYNMLGGYGASIRRAGELTADKDAKEGNLGEEVGKFIQFWANGKSDEAFEALSPQAQKIMQASVTDPDFWNTDNIWLQGAAQAPHILSSVIAAAIMKTPKAAYAMEAATADAMMTNDLYRKFDKLTDDQLKAVVINGKSPYADARANGMNERQARREFAKQAIGWRPEMLAAVTATVGAIDPSGMIARKLVGPRVKEGVEEAIEKVTTEGVEEVVEAAPKSVVRRVPEAAALGGLSEAVQGGTEAALTQEAEVSSGLREDYDVPAAVRQALTEGVVGGVLGGGIGFLPDRKPVKPYVMEEVDAEPLIKENAPDQPMAKPDENKTTTGTQTAGNAEKAKPGVAAVDNSKPPMAQPTATTPSKKAEDTPVVPVQPVVTVNTGLAPDQQAALTKTEVKPVGAEVQVEGAVVGPNATVAATTPEAIAARPVPAPLSSETANEPSPAESVTLESNIPVAAATEVAQPAPVQPTPETAIEARTEALARPPVVDIGERIKARQRAAVRQPAPIPETPITPIEPIQAPTPVEATARVLENVTPEGKKLIAKARRQQDAKLARNVKPMIAPEPSVEGEVAPVKKGQKVEGSKNWTPAQRAQRGNENLTAQRIVEENAPPEHENNIYRIITEKTSDKVANTVVAARKSIANRVDKIMAGVKASKIELPKQIEDGADAEMNYNTAAILALEAKALQAKIRAKTAKDTDYRRFKEQELNHQMGDRKAMVDKRRTEGGIAKKQAGAGSVEANEQLGTKADTRSEDEANVPEERVSEAEQVAADTEEDVLLMEEQEATPKARERESYVAKMEEGEGYTVGEAKQAKVEIVKKRTIQKPPPAGPKLAEVKERVAERKPLTLKSKEPPAPAISEHRVLTPQEFAARIKERVAQKKAEVTQAREQTDTEPTPAQMQAGNYKKGRVSINGIPMVIETPKGTSRSGVDDDGETWSVKMRHDYDYIEGTKGEDGDQLDVLLGPDHDATHVFVIDQVNPITRSFDEQKVLASFRDLTNAMRGYNSMFSDGSGDARAENVTIMTVPEFKQWMDTPVADRRALAREFQREANEARIERDIETLQTRFPTDDAIMNNNQLRLAIAHNKGKIPEGYIWHSDVQRGAPIIRETTVKDYLRELNLDKLTGANRVFANILRTHLTRLVGNVKVKIMTPEDMAYVRMKPAPYGWHDANAEGGKGHIVINADNDENPLVAIHTALHEAVHAGTVRAITDDIGLRMEIREIMDYVQSQFDAAAYNDQTKYGFKNEKEFVAEALTSHEFQQLLRDIPAPPELVSRYGLDLRTPSMWDVLVDMVRKALNIPKGGYTMMDVAMRVSEAAFDAQAQAVDRYSAYEAASTPSAISELSPATTLKGQAQTAIDRYITGSALAPSTKKPWLLRFRGFDSIVRAAERFFKNDNPVRRLADLIEGRQVVARQLQDQAAPIVTKLRNLSHKYKGKQWENFANLLHDETMTGVFADQPLANQKHIPQTGASGSWQRAQHAGLAAKWAALPADLKAARSEAMKFFTDQQNQMSLETLKNRIAVLTDSADPDGLAQRMFDGTETQQDKDDMGDMYETIKEAGSFTKLAGPYFPLMRRGNFVVRGNTKITLPSNAQQVADNEFVFDDRDEAGKWAATQDARNTMRSFYVDGQGNPAKKGDPGAIQKTKVVIHNQFMEMYDTLTEAREVEKEMRAEGIDVRPAEERRFEQHGLQQNLLSTQLQNAHNKLVERAEARGYSESQIREMITSLNEAAINAMGATRIQSHRLPRRHVQGASKDLIRNMADYSISSSNHIAKLQAQPKIDQALKDMEARLKVASQSNDPAANAMRAISSEVVKRITDGNPMQEGKLASVVTRILTISSIDKLASPAYSMVNATQPAMISLPYLASKYGIGRAALEMSRVYRDIGSFKSVMQGIGSTVAAMRPGSTSADPVSVIRSRLKSPREQAFIDAMVERGQISNDAGFEVAEMTRSYRGALGVADKWLSYADNMARQMPKTIEAINRTATGLTAFRLEMARSGDVAKATQFAQDTINQTQFNYSASNSAPIFNHPLGRMVTQFKKYGASMYQFMGEQIGVAIRNENPGDRAQAIRALSYTMAMHALMAGALGLPTEPLKWIINGLNAAGLSDMSWKDVEDEIRNNAADLFGKDLGEMMTRGVTRGVGIDLSSRLGMDTLVGPFGEPRSNEAQDWKAFMFDAFGGAPAGLFVDWAKGVNDLANAKSEGDVMRGMERLIPIKVISDSIKAARIASEGSISETTGKRVMSPYSYPEAITKALGFQSGREAESFERSGSFYRQQQKLEDETVDIKRRWSDATGAGRGRIWAEAQKRNKTLPRDARISLSDLRKYDKRVRKEQKETVEGIRATKRDKHLERRVGQTYNFVP